MTKQIALLLQPERRVEEKFADYVERRKAAKSYVSSALLGNVFWNTQLSGQYLNEKRKERPVGKSGRRLWKAERVLNRQLTGKSVIDLSDVTEAPTEQEATA